MKNKKRWLAALLVVALAFSLAGCNFREVASDLIIKVMGVDESDTEEPSNDIYAPAGGSVTFPEGMDTASRFVTTLQDGNLYIAFNGIANRSTGYFTPAGDSVTISSYASTDSPTLTEYKAALWQLSDDETSTQYVPGTTVYFTTSTDQSCYTYTVSGLDVGKRYKVVVSYDSGKYYVSGGMQVQGVGGDALKDVEGQEGEA
ncbi:MAG: hypothetical protein PHO10_03495 [Gemmiger sp.]|nr:hypothetical protein [Gemmiger sp.]